MAIFTADFETTTDPEDCRVWSYGIMEVGNRDNFTYGNNFASFMKWARNEKNATVYFRNLKFDGEFVISWLLRNGYRHVKKSSELEAFTFSTLISDKGQFYSIKVCFKRSGRRLQSLTIYDSLKILPFSIEATAKAFDLPIEKLKIDYHEKREVGHVLTPEEIEYQRNDVEIDARALEILFSQGMNKMTTGSNAMHDYKARIGAKTFDKWFPPPEYDADIRQAYKGGFTYVNPYFKNKPIAEGIVLDVNSLYPSVMYYEKLPYGEGKFFEGKYEEDNLYDLYIQHFSCEFELKEGHIPTVQLKNNLAFIPTDYVTSSDGEEIEMCMTNIDLALFLEHYDVDYMEYHNGWKFRSATGMFKDYIDYWNNVKVESTINNNAGMRTLAKLMLNSLYGKFALNPNVRSKYPYLDKLIVKYQLGEQEQRAPIYIPVGVFITSYARNKTIRAAQSVYPRFMYADTDSLHLCGTELPEGLDIDSTRLGAWKHESTFSRAKFIRAKTYIEEIDGKLHITCAGMPSRCYEHVTWDNFKPGAVYEGKLRQVHVVGGIVLVDTPFTIKE